MIAIIPARGGSKRLPNKNIKLLCGKPLIAYSIDAAKESKYIKRIIVSTDSKDIADTAIAYGAEVPFMRPNELATDSAISLDVFCYTIDRLNSENEIAINEFIVLQPTSPLRTALDIDSAIELFYEKKADSVISVTKTVHTKECIHPITPNGSIYILKLNLLKKHISYYTDNTFPYIMPAETSVDIDTLADFEHAEFLMKRLMHGQKTPSNF